MEEFLKALANHWVMTLIVGSFAILVIEAICVIIQNIVVIICNSKKSKSKEDEK